METNTIFLQGALEILGTAFILYLCAEERGVWIHSFQFTSARCYWKRRTKVRELELLYIPYIYTFIYSHRLI